MGNKPTTHVLIVTDRSGSMHDLADDVRGGFNDYLDKLADDGNKYRVTATLFSDSDRYEVLCTAAKLADVPRLNETNYTTGGFTALYDAIGKTITDFERKVPQLPEGDRVLLLVQTDGQENASREYTQEAIRQMMKQRTDTGRWGDVFLGAGPDTWKQGAGMGFTSSVGTQATGGGTRTTFDSAANATRSYAGGATSKQVAEDIRAATQAPTS